MHKDRDTPREKAVSTWQIWREDKAAVAQHLECGQALEGHNSAFGDNDLIIGFLMVEGFWSVLVETEADLLKKENGYPARILNGLWALCELAGVERIAQIISCVRLRAIWPEVRIALPVE